MGMRVGLGGEGGGSINPTTNGGLEALGQRMTHRSSQNFPNFTSTRVIICVKDIIKHTYRKKKKKKEVECESLVIQLTNLILSPTLKTIFAKSRCTRSGYSSYFGLMGGPCLAAPSVSYWGIWILISRWTSVSHRLATQDGPTLSTIGR